MTTTKDLDLLRAISMNGAVTAAELQATMPALGDPRTPMERLWRNHFLDRDLDAPSKPAIYTVAAKGRRALMRAQSAAALGDMPTPRTSPPSQPYQPPAQQYTRPGSGDAFELPSLSPSGERIARKKPALIGGKGLGVTP